MSEISQKRAVVRSRSRMIIVPVALMLFCAILVYNLAILQFLKYDYYKNCGFKVIYRDENRTQEETMALAEEIFKLK